jgi:hypothetical protein
VRYALVLGDLALDPTWQIDDELPPNHPVGRDLTFAGTPAWTPSGTALLFARALTGTTEWSAVVIAAVGADWLEGDR